MYRRFLIPVTREYEGNTHRPISRKHGGMAGRHQPVGCRAEQIDNYTTIFHSTRCGWCGESFSLNCSTQSIHSSSTSVAFKFLGQLLHTRAPTAQPIGCCFNFSVGNGAAQRTYTPAIRRYPVAPFTNNTS